MPWKYTQLANTLSGLYYRTNNIEAIIKKAGLNLADYVLDGSSANVIWTLAIAEIEKRRKIQSIVSAALEENPDNPILQDYFSSDTTKRDSVYAGDKPAWKGGINKGQFEIITEGQSTLLPISFLELGLMRSKAVARIITPTGMGSGFLISDSNLLLTNNHVIKSKPLNEEYKAQFNYQKTIDNLDESFEEFEIDDSVFETSIEDDWTVVKIKGNPSAKYKYLSLKQVTSKKDDFVNIIQHPGGGPKQIGLYHNLVTFVNDSRVQYLTDTLPGASGSPVFNKFWDVVALHHSGGWMEEPGENGPAVLRNEGININVIIQSVREKGLIT